MSDSHISTYSDSILPVVTKCKPNNNKFDYDKDMISNDIYEILCLHFNTKLADDMSEQQKENLTEDLSFIY